MRVFVTGSGGFVGGHLVPRLVESGALVTATDREVDVADAGAVAETVARVEPDAIVHLAAISSVPESRDAPDLTYRVNFLGTRSILEAAAAMSRPPRVLVVGSGDQYGPAPSGAAPFTENDAFHPASPYSRTKAAADLLATEYAERGLDVVRVRAFNHTGPGQSDAFVASSFARQVAKIEAGHAAPRLRVGNLDSVRDFLDVEDVVDAYVRLLDRKIAPDAYNVASGTGIRVGALLEMLLGLARLEATIEVDPARHRATDFSVGDASRLRAATGWAPRIPLATTLERLLDFWRREIMSA